MIDLTGSTPSAVAAKLSSLFTSSANPPDSSGQKFTSVIEGFLEPSQTGSLNENGSNSNSAPYPAPAAERGSTPEFVSGCAWMLGDSAAHPAASIGTTPVTSAPP